MSEVEVNLFQPDGQYTEQGNALHEYLLEAHAEKRYDRLSEAEESFASMCVTHPIMTPGEWMRSHPNEVKEAIADMDAAKNAQGGQQEGAGVSPDTQSAIAEALSDFRSEFKNELTTMFDDFRQSLREGGSPSGGGDGGGSGGSTDDNQEAMGGMDKGKGGASKRKRTRKSMQQEEDGDPEDGADE